MNLSKKEIAKLSTVITELVNEFGHPDEIPMGTLAERGIDPETAVACEALLSQSDEFISDPGGATARWLRVIGEYAK